MMKRQEIEEKFIDLLEGNLPDEEQQELLKAIDEDDELKNAFTQYKEVVEVEEALAAEELEVSSSFADNVLRNLPRKSSEGIFQKIQNFFGALYENHQRLVFSSVATAATLVICLKVAYDTPHEAVSLKTLGLEQQEFDSANSSGVALDEEEMAAPASQIAKSAPVDISEMVLKDEVSSIDEKISDKRSKDLSNKKATDPDLAGGVAQQPAVAPESQRREGFAVGKALKKAKEHSVESRSRSQEISKPEAKNEAFQAKEKHDDAPTELTSVRKRNSGVASGGAGSYVGIDELSSSGARNQNAPKKQRSFGALERQVQGEVSASDSFDQALQYRVDGGELRKKKSKPKKAPQRAFDQKHSLVGRGDTLESDIAPEPSVRGNKVRVGGKFDDELAADKGSVGRLSPSQDANVAKIERESYQHWKENPRVLVSEEARSTFSIDVDTASYTNARRFLRTGHLPPADSVRIEEFINYFKFDYPVQSSQPFGLVYEIAPSPLENDRYLMRLGVNTRSAGEATRPWNLVFLIDVSGSMASANKLGLVKQSLKLLVNRMRSSDRISIVTYSGEAQIALHPTGIEHKSRALQAINSLSAGGSTHGSSGLQTAYQLAQNSSSPDSINRVILATDGDFNVGVTSNQQLIQFIEQKKKTGIELTTIGVGTGNLKDAMMEQLANKGNGNYFYLDSFKEARRVFETELVSTIETVAKDVKLQVEFNPEHVFAYRLIGYENRVLKNTDFSNDAVDAGEIGAGHTVTALYEVVLTGSPLAKTLGNDYRYKRANESKAKKGEGSFSDEVAFLQVRYKEPEETKSKLTQFPMLRSEIKKSSKEASDDFRFVAAVSYFGHLLRKSEFAEKYTFRDVEALASTATGTDRSGQRREFVELVRTAASVTGQ